MKKEEQKQETPYRDLADFPGVDDVEVVNDLSFEAQCHVLNPHPGLEYRFVRDVDGRSKVPLAKERGWRDNPPGLNPKTGNAEPAKHRGHTPDVRLMAMSKELWAKRDAAKVARAETRASAALKSAAANTPGVKAEGGDLRITRESGKASA